MPLGLRHHPETTSARYKRSKYHGKDAQLLVTLRPGNMRFLLLTVLCSVASLTAATEKPKRDILPGDIRYGTDYHNHHHHHHQEENELEVSRSLGGYVGSYSVLNDESKQSYGPPDYQPSKPLSIEQHTTQVPLTSYGVPEVNQAQTLDKQYLSPVIEAAKKVQSKTLTTLTKPVETVLLKKETVDLTPSVNTPITSYGKPVTTVEIKTSTVPLVNTKVEPSVTPEIREHLQEIKTVHKALVTVPQVSEVAHPTPAIDSSVLLPVNNLPVLNTDITNLTPLTVDQSSTFTSELHNHPDFDAAYQFNLRNLGSIGSQQKLLTDHLPNLYVSPYTYGVPYQFPQTLYSSQEHQALPSQFSNLVPYPLAGNNHLFRTNIEVKKPGLIGSFFQQTFPNFQLPSLPLIPQFPSIPSIGSTDHVTTPVPIPASDNSFEIRKPVEVNNLGVVKHVSDNTPVVHETSLKKISTVVTKPSNEYIQPVDDNGGYVY